MRLLLFLPAMGYQILACVAALRYRWNRPQVSRATSPYQPPVSVLKPVRGLDPNTFEAFVSQAQQQYPQFEILFGVRDSADPVIEEIRRLQEQSPHTDIRLILTTTDTLNAKAGTLIELSKLAKYEVLVVNDADIKVDPHYLTSVVAPLADPNVGVVTCPYRAWAHSPATRWEALGISTDFMLSVFVAHMLGIRDFGMGATLAFRAADLETVGGFAAFAEYIADDYQLAKRITLSGKRAVVSGYVVETSLGESTWGGVWQHQLRWARTIRTAKPSNYVSLPLTHAGIWMVLALAVSAPTIAAILLLLRWGSALLSVTALDHRAARKWFRLAPLWDVYAFCLWIASYTGNRVRWRHRMLRLDSAGRIVG